MASLPRPAPPEMTAEQQSTYDAINSSVIHRLRDFCQRYVNVVEATFGYDVKAFLPEALSRDGDFERWGGLGVVRKYKVNSTGARVAVKTLTGVAGIVTDLEEAAFLASLSCIDRDFQGFALLAGIPQSAADTTPVSFVTSWVDGNTWEDFSNLLEEVECLLQVVELVQLLHRHHICHGDLHSENIWIDHEMGVHIIDFGRGIIGVFGENAEQRAPRLCARYTVDRDLRDVKALSEDFQWDLEEFEYAPEV